MNGRLRKVSALFASAAVAGAAAVAMLAAPAGAISACEIQCSVGTTNPTLNYSTAAFELGTKFTVSNDSGDLTAICYKVDSTDGDTGTDPVTLWDASGNKIASGAAVSGCYFVHAALAPGTYTASYASGKYYQETPDQVPGTGNGDLSGPAQGVYSGPGVGVFPTIGGYDFGVSAYFDSAPTAAPTVIGTPTFGSTPSISLAVTGDGYNAGEIGFVATCTQTDGKTASVSSNLGPNTATIVVPGFATEIGDQATCTVRQYSEAFSYGDIPSVAGPASATYVEPLDPASVGNGKGCATTLTAPTALSSASEAFPGAVVSWAPATSDPANCISGYLVTPSSGKAVFVSGGGTTTVVRGLTEGSTYTFTVAAVSGATRRSGLVPDGSGHDRDPGGGEPREGHQGRQWCPQGVLQGRQEQRCGDHELHGDVWLEVRIG